MEQRLFYSLKTVECLLNVKNQKIKIGYQNNRDSDLLLSSFLHRTVCSSKTSLTHLSMFTGLAILESKAVTYAANAGISLSTVLNVQAPFQLMVSCVWRKEVVEIPIASAILRGTATTSTKARCAWDSGSLIVLDTVEVMTPTQAAIQCPGSLLKKFLNPRLRSLNKIFMLA